MRLLVILNGEYGERHAAHVRSHAPATWQVNTWQAPRVLPPVIDYPEDYLPPTLPPADLLLAVAEHKGVAELLPDIARMTGAQAVIAAVDNENWLPRGLARQLRHWLAEMGVACVTPKPLCSLTPTHYHLGRRQRIAYDHPLIAEFARLFGQPELELTVDPETRTIVAVEVRRDSVCGCARFVAAGLIGASVDEAEQQAGMLHHHFPCLASMGMDPDYGDTLLHVSGHLLREQVAGQVRAYRRVSYIVPAHRSE
jgi:hypothetical protein